MKPKFMVHPSQARCIDNPVEQERLAAIGWLIAQTKPKTKMAGRMRSLRAQRREAGWQSIYMWLDPEQVAAVSSALRPGETYVELLVRLIEERSLPQ